MRLSDKKNNAPIPYRDSKLTRLLQPALEGDSKVNIICNISPCAVSYEETLSTLKFAQRAKKIKQTIAKNEALDSKALLIQYQQEIHILQGKLREMETKMVHEVNKDKANEMNQHLMFLQEEKEKADEKLENLLQEKLQLQKELERYKSFIIHPEDIKSHKISNVDDDGVVISYRLSIENIHKMKEEAIWPAGSFASIVGSDTSTKCNFKVKETMLTDNIEKIPDILDSCEPLARCSGAYVTANKDLHTDCFKIIEEQDRLLQILQKALSEKDEEIGILKDELTLCRNNLATIQKNYKKVIK